MSLQPPNSYKTAAAEKLPLQYQVASFSCMKLPDQASNLPWCSHGPKRPRKSKKAIKVNRKKTRINLSVNLNKRKKSF